MKLNDFASWKDKKIKIFVGLMVSLIVVLIVLRFTGHDILGNRLRNIAGQASCYGYNCNLPSLTMYLDRGSPRSATIQAGISNVPFTLMQFIVTGGDVTLNSIQVHSFNSPGNDKISKISLVDYDTGAVIGSSTQWEWTSPSDMGISISPVFIANNSLRKIMIRADLKPTASGKIALGITGIGTEAGIIATHPINVSGSVMTIVPRK